MNSGKALLGLMVHHEGAKTSDRCPCSLPREATVPLNGMRIGEIGGLGSGCVFQIRWLLN